METYNHLCAQFYELDKPTAPAAALSFYLEYAKNADGPIFEPMCGTGLYLIPMLEKGFDIEGSDASPHMLAVCKEKCDSKKLQPELYQQFLQQMALKKRYALIFIPSGSFGLITDTLEARKCLNILYDHLLPGGRLVFEIETIDSVPNDLGNSQERIARGKNGEIILLHTTSSYLEESQILKTICHYELIQSNNKIQEEIEDFKIRLYQNAEIDDWLKDAGFKNIARYSDYDRNKSSSSDEMIIYACEKV